MRRCFYPKLALAGIRKNRRFYYPYLLTCIGMIMMFYLIAFLSESTAVANIKHGSNVMLCLRLGKFVIAVFAGIFLLYTNSFLMKRRKRELGLYSVLGMNRKNMARLLTWESVMTAGISLTAGLGFGIAFSKLTELLLLNLMGQEVGYGLQLSADAVLHTVRLFVEIFLLLLLWNLFSMRKSSPLALMREEQAGERPPKANWVLALFGAALLGGAYALAVSCKDPLTTVFLFMIAVVMVIVATYLLMISGSVTLCRFLQKKKRYYYRRKHFVAVSSMGYRMRRNGASLASICILSTMVLVMLSSTASLYFGKEDTFHQLYPREMNLHLGYGGATVFSEEAVSEARELITQTLREKNATAQREIDARRIGCNISIEGKLVRLRADWQHQLFQQDNTHRLQIFSLEDYNRVFGENETLGEQEVLLCCEQGVLPGDDLEIEGVGSFHIKKRVKGAEILGDTTINVTQSVYLIVSRLNEMAESMKATVMGKTEDGISLSWTYRFDVGGTPEQQHDMMGALRKNLSEMVSEQEENSITSLWSQIREEEIQDFLSAYGGLFFLGIILSVMFAAATILMIYYKQISEGYEDEKRFEIMQKIGMTRNDIRKNINAQMLTVFFAPLLLAGVHLTFAFPMIWNSLQLFGLHNLSLLILVTVLCFGCFAVLYCLLYRLTSQVYYSIVSGVH